MMGPAQAWRLIQINRVLSRNGLAEIIFAAHLFRPLRFVYYSLPWNWFASRNRLTRGERIRKSLEELGPIFVKFGQIVSTRRDLLPEDIADELAKLQDQVPPFSTKIAREIIESTYGMPLSEVFDEFSEEPLASASVAQVYTAKLKTGADVIVKVIRPDIRQSIRHDIKLLKLIAEMAHRYSSQARRLRPKEIVADYEKTILDELDLKHEAANASLIRRNFKDSKIFYVPEVVWDLTRTNIMVMERISGVSIRDIDCLHANKVNMKVLAERGVEIFFTQVFVHNFFHADMHPGNIFIDIEDPENPKYIGVDFGIVGTLSLEDKRYLAQNFLAFFNRDYRRVAQLHIDSGWAPSAVKLEEFEAAIRTVSEPIFERPLKEISFGRFLLNLFQTARRFDMQIQPQLVLLQKTLLNIEGLGRQLYPDLDLWSTAKPFLEKSMRKQIGFQSIIDKLPIDVPDWVRQLPDVPDYILNILRDASIANTYRERHADAIDNLKQQLEKNNRKSVYITVGSVLLLSGSIIFTLVNQVSLDLNEIPFLSWLLPIPGLLMLGFAWIRG